MLSLIHLHPSLVLRCISCNRIHCGTRKVYWWVRVVFVPPAGCTTSLGTMSMWLWKGIYHMLG